MNCAVKVKHMEEQHKKNKKKLINNWHISHISYRSSSLRDQTLLVKFISFFFKVKTVLVDGVTGMTLCKH